MEISPIAFYLLAGIAVAFSVLVVLKRSAITSAFCLVLVFFSFAGIYALLGAHLVAALQVLVYAGAVMVLFAFVIMLINSEVLALNVRKSHIVGRVAAGLGAVLLLGLFIWIFRHSSLPSFPVEAVLDPAKKGNTELIAEKMFSEYILPFELTSVLLLAAIVGATVIAKRKGLRDAR